MCLFGLLNVILPAVPLSEFGYAHIPVQVETNVHEKLKLSDEEFLIAPPTLMGFSLSDKLWRKSILHCHTRPCDYIICSGVQRGENRANRVECGSIC